MEKLQIKDVSSHAQILYSLDLSGTDMKDVKMDIWSSGVLSMEYRMLLL